jgi:subtilisin family serine protease
VVEALPPRTLLSVTPAVAARLEADGFQRVPWHGRDVYAQPGEWVVSLRGMSGGADQQVASATAKLRRLGKGLRVVGQLGRDGLFKISAPRATSGAAISTALRKLRNFDYVEPNAAVWAQGVFDQRDDPFYSMQYGLNNTGAGGGVADADVDAPEAWAMAGGNAREVVVGLIDTGVDYAHPDLAASMWTNPFEVPGDGVDNDHNGFVDDVHGADFVDHDGAPLDEYGHGTHVASIIAAQANNGVGGTGVAPNVKIMSLRFLNAQGTGDEADAVAALNYAMDMKSRGVNIRLTNNSWGTPGFSQALQDAVQASGNAGMLFVAAAGNGGADGVGDDNDKVPFYPASFNFPNVISVAASDDHDLLGALSNFGKTSVDLAAPGMQILGDLPDTSYGYISGTSLATPHVSGAAALAFGVFPNATWQDVRSAIFRSVDPIPSMAGKTVTGGRLNVLGTLRALAPAEVVARSVFYNGSSFDGRDASAGAADDAAIATDKAALLPGRAASFANYTSYSKGINGIMVDVRGASGLDASDFALAVRDAGGNWLDAPAPAVTVRAGAGRNGSDRVTLTWPDGAIRDTWLRVTVLADAVPGLMLDDTFYFGNLVGETGNAPGDATVNAFDYAGTRTAQRAAPAAVDNPYDFNRDGVVNALDLAVVRRQSSTLPLLTVPNGVPPSPPPAASAASFSTTPVSSEPLEVQSVTTLVGAERFRPGARNSLPG